MSRQHERSHVSVYRRQWRLTQAELARILGLRGGNGSISHIEEGQADVSLDILFALQVVFGKEGQRLFPARFFEIEEEVLTRAYALYDELQGKRSKLTKLKLDFLEDMFARAKQRRDARGV